MRNYINISGFDLNQPNRGNAALNYGAVSFLLQKGLIDSDTEFVAYRFYRNFFKAICCRKHVVNFFYEGRNWQYTRIPVSSIERWLLKKIGITLPWTTFGKTIKKTKLAVADYGGDGFSDIYGQKIFDSRFIQTNITSAANIPLIVLPQTIGPFQRKENYDFAIQVLKYAKEVYVRDGKFIDELKRNNIPYIRSKDLSSFMLPEKWEFEPKSNPIGINVSGLAYFNKFINLEGQFDCYPNLICSLIDYFRTKQHSVYLIPHSYNYERPEENNDDILACREAFNSLKDKTNVYVIDKNLSAPQIKYAISQMLFFVGTRMHANFAAIYSGIPLFGLAYSYKFAGAFFANGLDGDKQTVMINNINQDDIRNIIKKLDLFYHSCFAK